MSFNSCPGGGDDDGLVPKDPGLPTYAAAPMCPWPICFEWDNPDVGCGEDPWAEDFSDEFIDGDTCGDDEDSDSEDSIDTITLDTVDSLDTRQDKNRRRRRRYAALWIALGFTWEAIMEARSHPSSSHLHDSTRSASASNSVFEWVTRIFFENPRRLG